MIIDCHTHTFPEKIAASTIRTLSRNGHIRPALEATADALRTSMEKAGIGCSVNLPVATAARQVMKLNDAAAAINEGETARRETERRGATGEAPWILSFGCMHPDYEDWHAELSRAVELGLKGIKIHPAYQGVDIDDIRFLRIIDRAAQLGLIVITHAGLDVGLPGEDRCNPGMIRHVVEQVGEFPFILAHMGGWKYWEEVPQMLADAGVYLDTAFSIGKLDPLPDGYRAEEELQMLTEEKFVDIVRAFGADRILFGTDSPWSGQKTGVEQIEAMPLTEEEKEKILGRNARRLLGI